MFDGPESPLTQTFGLGMFSATTPQDLDRLEAFFVERAAPVFHEVSPQADESTLALLNERGYRPIEFTSILYRPLDGAIELKGQVEPALRVRAVEIGEEELWARVSAQGWSEHGDFSELMNEVSQVSAAREDAQLYLAELDGRAVASAAIQLSGEVCLLAGACTIPDARRRGAQLALLGARLELAESRGANVAMMGARPGSASQRNAERHGFRIAYTRIKWGRLT